MGAEVDRAALLAALRLQMEWGADEALADAPLDRTALSATLPPPGAPFPAAAKTPPPAARGGAAAPPPASHHEHVELHRLALFRLGHPEALLVLDMSAVRGEM